MLFVSYSITAIPSCPKSQSSEGRDLIRNAVMVDGTQARGSATSVPGETENNFWKDLLLFIFPDTIGRISPCTLLGVS
jgi:hypothetical protein